MTSQRYDQIEELYHAARALAPAQRAVLLTEACASDEELRREVELLLANHDEAGSFLNHPALEAAAEVIAAEQESALIGRRLSHYRITARIGAGGMGEVYLAEDEKLGRKIALKLLPSEFTANPERIHRFEREAKAASATDHPNIITIHEIGEADGIHFIAEEFVAGETLRQRIRRAPMPTLEVLGIAQQIAAALAAAHQAGIVHRDIKPENVMLRPDGFVKVLDFGLAAVAQPRPLSHDSQMPTVPAETTPGTILGTVSYMSPEQVRGQKADARSDLWSFGVVLYEMLTGHTPFPGASTPETFVAILDRAPLPLDGQPPELEQLIAKLLAKDRDERYPAAAPLAAELKKLHHRLELDAERHTSARDEDTLFLHSPISSPAAAHTGDAAAVTAQQTPVRATHSPRSLPAATVSAKAARSSRVLIVTGVCLLIVLGAAVWWAAQRNPPVVAPSNAIAQLPERSFTYSLTVQKIRDGQPYQAKFQSAGRDFYENGWRFRLNFSSPQAGYLYIINEGPTSSGAVSYTLLFPLPSINNATAQIAPHTLLQTNDYLFDQHSGVEKFWVVWAAQPSAELEQIKAVVLNAQAKGTITNPQQRDTVRALLSQRDGAQIETVEDKVRKQTKVTGRGEPLLYLIELEHH
jgi:serine/threonine protein kinase